MKKILKEYTDVLREIKRLDEKRKELLKQLLHAKTPDGKELGNIVRQQGCTVRELIVENMPDDATDDEYYRTHFIRDELRFLKRDMEIETERMNDTGDYCPGPPRGTMASGCHEGW